jgi:hypothetical protein
VILKDVPGPLLRRYGWRMLKAQLRIAWEALRAWRGAAARARLRGQLAALVGLPRVLRQRRAVQAARVGEAERIMTNFPLPATERGQESG